MSGAACGAALRLADAKTARFAAHAAARSLDERSATRRAAALRAHHQRTESLRQWPPRQLLHSLLQPRHWRLLWQKPRARRRGTTRLLLLGAQVGIGHVRVVLTSLTGEVLAARSILGVTPSYATPRPAISVQRPRRRNPTTPVK